MKKIILVRVLYFFKDWNERVSGVGTEYLLHYNLMGSII